MISNNFVNLCSLILKQRYHYYGIYIAVLKFELPLFAVNYFCFAKKFGTFLLYGAIIVVAITVSFNTTVLPKNCY